MFFSEMCFLGVWGFPPPPDFQLEEEIFVKVDVAPLLTSLNYV